MIAEKDNHGFVTAGEEKQEKPRIWGALGGASIAFCFAKLFLEASPSPEKKASCAAFQAAGNVLTQAGHAPALAPGQRGGPPRPPHPVAG